MIGPGRFLRQRFWLAGATLIRKNPRGKADLEHMPPEQLADDILRKEVRIAELIQDIKVTLRAGL